MGECCELNPRRTRDIDDDLMVYKGTGEIKSGNTLSTPQYLDEFNELKKFDFIVMNHPFSDKSWTDGIKPSEDKYKRFDGYSIPPEKNGDYA